MAQKQRAGGSSVDRARSHTVLPGVQAAQGVAEGCSTAVILEFQLLAVAFSNDTLTLRPLERNERTQVNAIMRRHLPLQMPSRTAVGAWGRSWPKRHRPCSAGNKPKRGGSTRYLICRHNVHYTDIPPLSSCFLPPVFCSSSHCTFDPCLECMLLERFDVRGQTCGTLIKFRTAGRETRGLLSSDECSPISAHLLERCPARRCKRSARDRRFSPGSCRERRYRRLERRFRRY